MPMIASKKDMQFSKEHWDEIIPKMKRYRAITGKAWPHFNAEDLRFATMADWYAALCAELEKLEAAN